MDREQYLKLSRLAYMQARAFGYRHMLANPVSAEQLMDALRLHLLSIPLFARLSDIAEKQAIEATGHILYVASTGQLEAAIGLPQGQFPVFG